MNGPRRPLRWYRHQPLGDRFHASVRWATCPFGAVEAELAPDGGVLDWGCGQGVLATWVAHRSTGRSVHGVDIDAAKLVVARSAAAVANVATRTSFATIQPEDLPVGAWRSVVVNDVLYLLTPDHQARLVHALATVVEPGGVLVAKVMGGRPRWKVWATEAQEALAVGRLGISASSSGVHRSPPIGDLVGWMTDAGLVATARPVDRHYHCPHVLVVGRRP